MAGAADQNSREREADDPVLLLRELVCREYPPGMRIPGTRVSLLVSRAEDRTVRQDSTKIDVDRKAVQLLSVQLLSGRTAVLKLRE
ncbi:hypothetical protein BWQ96_06759 [Gracilariopsis chorda]|uniref:Uncharacterized protein n=1 Tax=Gracilariopsis chorda TaxID=448386 RepID=A0A2V3IN07_9FLOR|nr:hypothetical protein BWQ96_06759 [Gracilariopsis chorda]|eukprot:PXF43466.1 hypothetical protein BWQ96_06759 [Gracilariopsis chorda]